MNTFKKYGTNIDTQHCFFKYHQHFSEPTKGENNNLNMFEKKLLIPLQCKYSEIPAVNGIRQQS